MRRKAIGYLVAGASVGIALLLKSIVSVALPEEEESYLFFFAAVMFGAWFGGFSAGIASLVLSGLAINLFYLEPFGSFSINGVGPAVSLGIFSAEGMLVCTLSASLSRAQDTAEGNAVEAREAQEAFAKHADDLLTARSELQLSEIRFRGLVDANIIGVIIAKQSGPILDANAAFLDMLGYDKADEQQLDWRKLTAAEYRAADDRALQDVQQHGRCASYEKEFFSKSGERVPVLFGCADIPLREGGLICFVVDMTEQKATEQALEEARDNAERASRLKSEFMANISHELRTPMNGIIGMTDLALEEELSERLRDYLSTARESADVLLRLLNDILDFSKIEADRLPLEHEPLSLRVLLDEVLKAQAIRSAEKGLELACHVRPSTPEHLIGDAVRLRQVLDNLLSNAIKFTDQGEVIVRAGVESGTSEEVSLHFEVADTGIGISEEDRQRIFSPFTQVDASATRQYGGTGLGLAICRELVSMMGGRMWVDSEWGEGSTFHFTARLMRNSSPPESSIAPAGLFHQLRHMQVLAVDDNATNRRIIEEMLKSWSMKPALAASAEEAIEMLQAAARRNEVYPLVLVDALMPGTDGFTLAQYIKEHQQLADATILMLSSADRQTFADRCAEVKIDAYLEKPVSQSDLLDAIVTAFDEQLNPTAEEVRTKSADPPLRTLSVLLAEDMPANQKVVQRILEKRGHAVEIAHNGRDAIDMYKQDSFDVILMDVQMPSVDGLQATRVIRGQEDSHRARIPIVALTAHAMRGDRQRCLSAGMDAYIAKPVNGRKLVELVESLADQKFGTRVLRRGDRPRTSTPPSASQPGRPAASEAASGSTGPSPTLLSPTAGSGGESNPEVEDYGGYSAGDTDTAADEADSITPGLDSGRDMYTSLFDPAAAEKRLGDRDIVLDSIRFFFDDVPELLDRVNRGLESEATREIERAAHSIKGLAANLNAAPAREAAWQLEQLASREKGLQDLRLAAAALRQEISRLEPQLQRFLAEEEGR